MTAQNPAKVIATRDQLIANASEVYNSAGSGDEIEAIIDQLLLNDFVSDKAFDTLGVAE